MARHQLPIEETLAWEIYTEIQRYSESHDVIPPSALSWFGHMTRAKDYPRNPGLGYEISYGEFRWHWNRLRIEQYIQIDPGTNAIRIRGVKILPLPD